MALSGRRIFPTEDTICHSYNYRGHQQGTGTTGFPRLPQTVHEKEMETIKRIKFIKHHFHRKECRKFVPVADPEVTVCKDLKCHCGDIVSNHDGFTQHLGGRGFVTSSLVPQEYADIVKNENSTPPNILSSVKWEAEESLQESPTNGFGEIVFDVEQIGGKKPAKYIRLADTDLETDALELMIKFWHITEPVPPKLVISVIGGAKNFKLDGRMRDTFSSGLIKAAKTTSAWLLTTGFNMGVMKAVGQAVHEGQSFQWDNNMMTHVLRCIGIAPWGYIKDRGLLESSDGNEKYNANYRTSNIIRHGQPVHLNKDHTHFIFVDDGIRNRYGGVADFRAKFEKHVMSPSGLDIPVVLVVVEGGHDAITDTNTSLKHGIPVVVVAGTGRAADILGYAYSHSVKSPNSARGEYCMSEKHIRVLSNKLHDAYSSWWEKQTDIEKKSFIDLVQECCKFKDKIIIFPINKHEDLDLAILTVLLKSQNAEKVSERGFKQLMLALTWNRADIAQEEIFREDINWEDDYLMEAMTQALKQDKVDFVKLILNQGLIMKEYLTVQKLEDLYNKIPPHSYIFSLIQRSSKKKGSFILSHIETLLIELLDKYSDMEYEKKGDKNGKPQSVTQDSIKTDNLIGNKIGTDETEKMFQWPYKQLLIWAVLMNRVHLALFFWEMGEEPLSTALAVTRLCLGIIKEVPKYQTRIREEFEEMKILFEKLAMRVVDECNSVDPEKAMMLVEIKSAMWSNMSCLQIAASAHDQAFLSSVACQNSINTTWRHGILSSWRYVFLGILCPLCIFFVEVDQRTERRQKFMTFYTAPMTKFGCYSLSYLLFLGLFSYLVLVDFKQVPTPVEWICIIWNFAFLTDEIHTFLFFPIPTMRGKMRDWFHLPNILDTSNLVIVFIGFGLRWNSNYFFDAKMIYCLNVTIFYLRILKVYTANSQLGPKLIMIRRMSEELIIFVMVLVVFLLAYGVAHQGLLYPQRQRSSLILKDIIYYPYWQLYGEIYLEEIETDTDCINALANTTVTPFNNTCRTGNWMATILLGAYLSVGNILLLNLLIAIFSHVFDTVEENSNVIWKFQMYFLVMEYDIKSSIIPPFNLFIHFYRLIQWCFGQTCCKKNTESPFYPELVYLQLFEKEMMANYIRSEKSSEANKLETKVNKLERRVDELTKMKEDELVADSEITTKSVTQPGEKQQEKDTDLDEVETKRKKKKHKKEKKRRKKEKHAVEKEKELDKFTDYEAKPEYIFKQNDSDAQST